MTFLWSPVSISYTFADKVIINCLFIQWSGTTYHISSTFCFILSSAVFTAAIHLAMGLFTFPYAQKLLYLFSPPPWKIIYTRKLLETVGPCNQSYVLIWDFAFTKHEVLQQLWSCFAFESRMLLQDECNEVLYLGKPEFTVKFHLYK